MLGHGRSVRGRFLRITIPLIFLSVMGVFGAIEMIAHRAAFERLEASSAALLRTQSAALANPLWNIDVDQIRLSLEAIATNRQIVAARVYGEDGEIIAQAGSGSALLGDELVLRQDISFDAGTGARQIGEIEFVVTPGEIWTQTRNRLLLAGLIALLAVTMEVGAALFALRRIVGVPLERLLSAINAEKAGRARQPVAETAPDEMGQVISAYNEMLDRQDAFETELQQQARMEGELKIGRDMQLSMVPHDFDDLARGHNVSLWAALEPAREVGGDFYDAFWSGEDTLCLCIGDVSDKGVPAALLMAVTKTMIKAFAKEGSSPSRIVAAVNAELCAGDHNGMFVTLFVALLNLKTGELAFTNAGHNPPFRLEPSGEAHMIADRNGPVVGALAGIEYSQSTLTLAPEETLFLYTDGVTEAAGPGGTLFGEASLQTLLADQTDRSARDMVRVVLAAVQRHEGATDRTDDITLLAATYKSAVPTVWRGAAEATLPGIGALIEDMSGALAGLDDKLVNRAGLVLDEILSNVVNHGAADGRDIRVDVTAEAIGDRLRLTICDTGPAFDPDAAATPDVGASVEDRQIGGLGLYLATRLSERFAYAFDGDRNTYRVVLGSGGERPDGNAD